MLKKEFGVFIPGPKPLHTADNTKAKKHTVIAACSIQFYGRHHQLVAFWPLWYNRFTDDSGYVPFVLTTVLYLFYEYDLPNKTIYRVCNVISNTTSPTYGAGSVYPSEASDINPSCLVFFYVVCVLMFVYFFFLFSYGVVSLFSIYEFVFPSVIFRPSFKIYKTKYEWHITLQLFGIHCLSDIW